MRSERKKGRSLLARLMVLLMIINLLSGINPSAVRAAENSDFKNYPAVQGTGENEGIIIKKDVAGYNNDDDTFNVKLTVEGSDTVIQNNIPLDIALVVDTSGSMAEPKNGWGINTNKKINKAKSAAKSFVDTLIPESNKGKVNIGVISFAENGIVRQNLTQNTKELKGAIDKLKAVGGTYTQEGLEKAADMLKAEDGHKKVMIVISDGEPTFAKGKHPNFGKKSKEDGYYKVNKGDTREGYEQWHGNGLYWYGKGHETSWYIGRAYYLVKIVDGVFGNGSLERSGWGKGTWPYDLMDSYFKDATVAFAKTMNKKIQVFSIGIGLTDNHLAKEVMNEIATNGKYMEAGTVADELGKILKELAETIQKRVHNGVITDPMSEQVEYIGDVKLAGTTDGVQAVFDNNTLKVSNINLGKGEKLEATYKVKLKKEWKDGKLHKTNGLTTLKPYSKGNLMEFNVPEIRANAENISITVNKEWKGPAPEGLGHLEFTVTPSPATDALKVNVFPDNNGKWTGRLENLPKYNNGSIIEYKVEEPVGNNYEKIGEIIKTESPNGDLVFTAKNKNTEKVTFSVKKEWGTTPTDLQFPAKVQLYKNDAKDEMKAFFNNEAKFTDLAKYDADGNEIKYTVKEVNEEGIEESGEKLTNKGFEYNVNHNDSKYSSTITNTCTNPYEQKFTAKLTKTWDGGISNNDVTFTFTNNADANKKYTLTLTAANFAGNAEWNGTIELPTYNTNSSPATYLVTEGEVKGFTSDKTSVDDVSAATPNVSFTNKRNTKNITVTKTWKGTPAEYKINTVEVILSGKVNGTEVYNKKQNIELGTDTTTFNNVPLTDENGAEIEYSVKEDRQDGDKVTLDGRNYIVSVEPDGNGGYIINNKYANLETDTIDVTLTKKWKDGVGNKAVFTFTREGSPNFSRTVELPKDVKDGKLQGNVEGDKWTVTVKLNKFNNNDEASIARYKVTEAADTAFTQTSDLTANDYIGEGGKKEVTFTNTRVMKELTLNKKWAGPKAGKAVFTITPSNKEVELKDSNNWHDTIALPVYELDGKVIEYTVTEEDVPGYKAKEKEQRFSFVDPAGQLVNRELTFINVKLLENNFIVNKTWKGTPAERVSFGVFDENNNKVDTLTLTKADALQVGGNIWQGQFKGNIFAYDSDAKPIKYVVKELDENGHPVEKEVKLGERTYRVTGTVAQGTDNIYNFTNVDVTVGDIKITKTWVGTVGAAKFGLFIKGSDDQITAEPEVLAQPAPDKFEVVFKGIKLTDDNGNAVEYEIKELGANGEILKTGDHVTIGNKKYEVSYDQNGNITNKELIDITVEKVWGENVPEIARQSVKFRITTDSKSDQFGKVYELNNEANNWSMSFKNLPLYSNGEKINYSVVETEINGDKVDLTQNLVPDANGKTVYYHKAFKITLDGANDITESKTVKITNSIREAEQPEDPNNRIIHVVKDWTANAKKKNVTVKLYKLDTAKGEIVAVEGKVVELTEANKWTAEFEVPKADNGEEIIYYAFETAIGDDSIDESKLSPNLYNDGYQIGEYEVTIAELTSDTQDAEFGDYGFYILNESDNDPVQPEEKVTINVTKKWAIPETSEYVKPVKVRLFVENGEYLVPVFGVDDLTLNTGNNWTGKFANLDKTDYDGNKIYYHVAEVGIEGEQDKEIISLSDMLNVNGYTIGKYHVVIDGDGTENVVITNDVKLIDVKAVKNWSGIVPRRAVQFTLYSSHDNTFDSTGKVVTLDGTDNELVATFDNLPALDSNGKPIVYYVFETRIGDAVSTFTALAEATTSYSVNVTGGRYDVVVTDNGTVGDKVVIIQNSYVPNSSDPVVPIIPGSDPGTITPDPTPGTTPTVDVPDDTTPQGNANTDNNTDADDAEDDGFVELDEDETPQGKANVKDNTGNDDAKRKETTDIEDDSTPQGNTALPKTGGTARDLFGLIGMGLIGLGLVFKKRRH